MRFINKSIVKKFILCLIIAATCVSTGCKNNASNAVKPIGIISAFDAELQLLLDNATITKKETIGGVEFNIGKLEGKDVVMAMAGVGKVLSASTTSTIINKYNIGSLIFTGIAGGVGDNVKVLDVVVADDLIQHDYGTVTNDGFVWAGDAGVDPKTGLIPVDKALSDEAYNAAVSVVGQGDAFRGTIVTGDQFIASESYVEQLHTNFQALATEMEGASVARVAYSFGVPTAIIRCMSDKADGLAHQTIAQFGDKAANISASIVIEMLKNQSK